ncbi:PRC-barrel domain-containing protein [Streptomyces silaceus]|uniref:PRC-barrel domain-containing protein n=1 Tax=Streptomyces silaceus TaxID=545123 RepID=UPI0007C6895F|nr:PRC-barrel domain-containing protein [Streptomyces silaceus]
MSALVRASGLTKRPVVTLGGADVAQVKDVVLDAAGGRIAGFTLAGRGLLSGPLRRSLPWAGVHALGADAVMIASAEVLEDKSAVATWEEASGGLVRGARVLTDRGVRVGTVVDVVVETGRDGRVVGVEMSPAKARGRRGRTVFLPLADRPALTGGTLMIPAEDVARAVDDLGELGAAVRRKRGVGGAGGPEVSGAGAAGDPGDPLRPDVPGEERLP